MSENGNVVSECRVSGRIMADGGLIGLSIRWAQSTGGDPEGADHPWSVGVVAVSGPAKTAAPPGKRCQLALSREDAPRFGVSVPPPKEAMVRDIEIRGEGGTIARLPVTLRAVFQDAALSMLVIDTTIGVLAVDGPAGIWSWRIPMK